MSDFKVGDKIRRPTWNREFWMQVEWVGDSTYAGRREGGQDCMISRNDEVVLWTPLAPFPFKAGDVLRRSNDHEDVYRWEVADPRPGTPYFNGRIVRNDSSGYVTKYLKECQSGEWVLCPKQETWTVTTEDRRPMLGDRYMLDGEVIVATGNHRSTSTGRPVIVKITRNKE